MGQERRLPASLASSADSTGVMTRTGNLLSGSEDFRFAPGPFVLRGRIARRPDDEDKACPGAAGARSASRRRTRVRMPSGVSGAAAPANRPGSALPTVAERCRGRGATRRLAPGCLVGPGRCRVPRRTMLSNDANRPAVVRVPTAGASRAFRPLRAPGPRRTRSRWSAAPHSGGPCRNGPFIPPLPKPTPVGVRPGPKGEKTRWPLPHQALPT